jgi:hypothetical protein
MENPSRMTMINSRENLTKESLKMKQTNTQVLQIWQKNLHQPHSSTENAKPQIAAEKQIRKRGK